MLCDVLVHILIVFAYVSLCVYVCVVKGVEDV